MNREFICEYFLQPTEMFLWLGNYGGELKAYNIYSSTVSTRIP